MAFKSGLGIQVDRAADAVITVVSPGDPFFTIAGGMILLRALVGICTTTFGGNATTLSFELNPDEATGANTVLTLAVDIGTATVLADIVAFVGAPGTALTGGHLASQVLGLTSGMGVACAPGVIGLVSTATFGAMRWVLWYLPIDVGASVVAIP